LGRLTRKIVWCSADQIDSVTYSYDEGIACWDLDGDSTLAVGTLSCWGESRYRNERYGYGRINAQRALEIADTLDWHTAVSDHATAAGTEKSVELWQNRPNPFNPETEIQFYLPVSSEVSLAIYDVHGRRVRKLVEDLAREGQHCVTWDGKNDRGRRAISGVYFLHLRAGRIHRTLKLVMVE
jgi:hypothetical protein